MKLGERVPVQAAGHVSARRRGGLGHIARRSASCMLASLMALSEEKLWCPKEEVLQARPGAYDHGRTRRDRKRRGRMSKRNSWPRGAQG